MAASNQSKPVDRFIELYNELDAFLRQTANVDRNVSFSAALKLAAARNASIRRRLNLLGSFGDLRNIIVHAPGYPGRVIAAPSAETLNELEAVVAELRNPKRLIPTFRRRLNVFEPHTSLGDVLKYMRANDFSQVLVRAGGRLSLLTVEGVAGWFEASVEDDIVSLREVSVEAAMALEPGRNAEFMSARSTVDEAIDRYVSSLDRGNPRIYAIVITENGRDTEQPLGIVTPWDLLQTGRPA